MTQPPTTPIARWRRAVEPLAHRQFRIWATARWTSAAGSSLAPLALAFAALDVGGSAADLGVVLAAGMASQSLLPLAGGVIGHRYPQRHVQVGSYALLGLLQSASAVLLVTGAMRMPALITLAVLTGAVTAVASPTGAAVVRTSVPAELVGRAIALESAGLNGVKVLGPAVGGVVIAAAGPGWAIAADAVSFLAAAALLTRLAPGAIPRKQEAAAAEFRTGWRAFTAHRPTMLLTASGAVVVPLWLGGYLVLGPAYADAHLGGPARWGLVVAGFTCGLLAGAAVCLAAPPTRPGWTTCTAAAVMASPPAAMAADAPLPVLVTTTFAAGFTLNVSIVVWRTWVQQAFPAVVLSRITGITGAGQSALVPAAYLVAGPVADHTGLRPALGGAAVLLAAAALAPLAAPGVRALRVHPAATPTAPDEAAEVPAPRTVPGHAIPGAPAEPPP
jgi:MFS family permease